MRSTHDQKFLQKWCDWLEWKKNNDGCDQPKWLTDWLSEQRKCKSWQRRLLLESCGLRVLPVTEARVALVASLPLSSLHGYSESQLDPLLPHGCTVTASALDKWLKRLKPDELEEKHRSVLFRAGFLTKDGQVLSKRVEPRGYRCLCAVSRDTKCVYDRLFHDHDEFAPLLSPLVRCEIWRHFSLPRPAVYERRRWAGSAAELECARADVSDIVNERCQE
jgi:hypothetical protein